MSDGSDATRREAQAARLLREVEERWQVEPAAALDLLDAALDGDDATYGADRARIEARRGQLRIFLGRLTAAEDGLRAARRRTGDPYLDLQLAAALGWRGGDAAWREASDLAGDLRTRARRLRDGPLAIAAACLAGEAALRAGDPDAAVRAYGEALGISEFSSSEAVSVAPLSGLATAHARGRAPGKAAPLAQRALERARRVGDRAGTARALLALGEAEDRAARFLDAAGEADAAPHRPLALTCRARAAEAGTTPPGPLLTDARAMGARDVEDRLSAWTTTRR